MIEYYAMKPEFNLTKAYPEDAGWDVRARLHEPLELIHMGQATVPTGIFLDMRNNVSTFCMLCPRSGLSGEDRIIITNSPGIIDNGFIGELKVCLTNLNRCTYTIQPYDKIAQLVFLSLAPVAVGRTDKRPGAIPSGRGSRGHGSSGR